MAKMTANFLAKQLVQQSCHLLNGETIERPSQVVGQIRHLVLDTSRFKVGRVYVK